MSIGSLCEADTCFGKITFDISFMARAVKPAFHHFLRGEAKFDSLDALIAQMDKDCAEARRLLSAQPL